MEDIVNSRLTKHVVIDDLTKKSISSAKFISSPKINNINSSLCHKIEKSICTGPTLANADTGTDGNYLCYNSENCVTNIIPDTSRSVSMPDGRMIESTHTGTLDLPSLPIQARKCWLFEELQCSLLCPGDWVDSGATVTYTSTQVVVSDSSGKRILCGKRDPRGSKLWMIDLNKDNQPKPVVGQVNAATYAHRSQAQLVAWYSAVLGNIADSTLLKAVSSGILTLPGLTAAIVAKYLPNSVESAKGHLDQTKSGIKSTNKEKADLQDMTDRYPEVALLGAAEKRRTITVKCMSTKLLHALYSDLAGRFPILSELGMEYVLVFFYEEGNYIHVEALPNRSGEQQAKAHAAAIAFFAKYGITSHDYAVMDNEISPEVRSVYEPLCQIQFVPPNTHRANKAERQIRTFVNHFIATLEGCDPTFPMKLWDRLLPQAEITLNMVRASARSINVSAYQHLCGAWDWNRYPLAPLGMRVVILEGADQRASWASHGQEGYHLGPALEHYRSYVVYCITTSRIRVTDTLSWHMHSKLLLSFNSPWDSFATDLSAFIDSIQALIELPDILRSAPRLVQRTIPALFDAIKQVREAFSDKSPDKDSVVSTTTDESTILIPASLAHHMDTTESLPLTSVDLPSISLPAVSQRVVTKATKRAAISPPPVATPRVATEKVTVANAEKILEFKGQGKSLKFRVRWVGHGAKDDTWEPISHVYGCVAFNTFCEKYPQFESLGKLSEDGKFIKQAAPRHSAAAILAKPHRSPYGYIGYNMHLHVPQPDRLSVSEAVEHSCAAVGSNATDGQSHHWHSAIRGPDAKEWSAAGDVELNRLVNTHKTMEFITEAELPKAYKMMYYNPVLTKKLKNGEYEYRVRGTAGGNNSSYEGDTAAYVADMTTFKILCNKTISDEGMRMSTADISDMYLHSKLEAPEYMWVRVSDIPAESFKQLNINKFVSPGANKVAVRIKGGMYGLPQAGRLAQEKLVKVLYDHGYYMCKNTTCLFKHDVLDTVFTLTVDDFAVAHRPKDFKHLLDALRTVYPITYVTDTPVLDYIGFKVIFDYDIPIRTCTLSMPGYMKAACDRFNVHPTTNTHNPEIFVPIVYGSRAPQLAKTDLSPSLSPSDKTLVQQIVGVLLWYARGVDGTILKAVNSVGSAQANPTEDVKAAAMHILHYGHTYPDASITYYASDMILSIDSDASYLGETNARSRAAGTFKFVTRDNPDYENGLIECISTIIPTIVSGASEAEYAGLFIMGQTGLAFRYTLMDLNCPQLDGGTRITCDNLTSGKLAHRKWKQKRSKPMDMRYHWIRDRCDTKDFYIQWRKGTDSIADLLTKTHPTPHFLAMRKHFVNECGPAFTTTSSRRRESRAAVRAATVLPVVTHAVSNQVTPGVRVPVVAQPGLADPLTGKRNYYADLAD